MRPQSENNAVMSPSASAEDQRTYNTKGLLAKNRKDIAASNLFVGGGEANNPFGFASTFMSASKEVPLFLLTEGLAQFAETALLIRSVRAAQTAARASKAAEALETGVAGGVTRSVVNAEEFSNGASYTIRDVNKHFAGTPAGQFNCLNCVIATDALLAGRPASALGFADSDGQLLKVLAADFGIDVTNKTAVAKAIKYCTSPTMIGKALKPGEQGIVLGVRAGDATGHYFNVVNQGGAIRFLDGQIGTTVDFSKQGFKGYYLLKTTGYVFKK